MNKNLDLTVDRECLIESLFNNYDREELVQFILDLDLRCAEIDFTENLIQKLQDSLSSDLEYECKNIYFNKLDILYKSASAFISSSSSKKPKELLLEMREYIDKHLFLYSSGFLNKLYDKGKESKNENIVNLSHAFGYSVLGIKHGIDRLGYKLSEIDFKTDKESEKYLMQIERVGFDFSNYIFNTTHYDNCNNGFYYRMS